MLWLLRKRASRALSAALSSVSLVVVVVAGAGTEAAGAGALDAGSGAAAGAEAGGAGSPLGSVEGSPIFRQIINALMKMFDFNRRMANRTVRFGVRGEKGYPFGGSSVA